MERKKCWTWVYAKNDGRLIGYIYNPCLKRDKTDVVDTMSTILDCKLDPKQIRVKHEY